MFNIGRKLVYATRWQQILQAPLYRWAGSFVFVVGVQVSAVFLALSWNTTGALSPVAPMAAMMVELAPMPIAPEIPPSAVAPGSVQKETPPEPVPEPEIESLPELPVIKQAEVVLPPEPEPIEKIEPVEELQAEEDTAPLAIEAPLAEKVAAPMEGAVSLAPSQAPATWESVLLGHLEHHKRYPRKARRNGHEAIVFVRVKINRDGYLIEHRLVRASDYDTLNRETLALISRAQPLPPPPAEVIGDTIEFVVPVAYSLRR